MGIYNKVIPIYIVILICYFYFVWAFNCDNQTEPTAHSHSRLKGFLHSSHFKKQVSPILFYISANLLLQLDGKNPV